MADRLPIYEIERDIIARLKTDRRLILSAPTGSGKSTQVPQMLLRHGLLGDGQVVILQPRRLATRLLAARVAQELGVQLGNEVGYQIRFENVTSPRTKIRFVTEGVLLRQMIDDPNLRGVSVLIFDEFHERHLYGDITLARALDLQEQHRPDLNLIVMSATLDVELLEDYLRRTGVAPVSNRVSRSSGTERSETGWKRVLRKLAAPFFHQKAACSRWKSNMPRSRVTRTNAPFGSRRPRRSATTSAPAGKVTCWYSCRAVMRFRRPSRPFVTLRKQKVLFCFHCTANFRPRTRTPRWRVTASAKWSFPPMSPRPR